MLVLNHGWHYPSKVLNLRSILLQVCYASTEAHVVPAHWPWIGSAEHNWRVMGHSKYGYKTGLSTLIGVI